MTSIPTQSGASLNSSGSIESHLSKANQRFRLPGSCSGSVDANLLPKHSFDLPVQECSNSTRSFSISNIGKLLLSDFASSNRASSYDESLTLPKRLCRRMFFCIRMTLVFYCCFSLVFAPIAVYNGFKKPIPNVPNSYNLPMSDAQKLSRVLSSYTIPPFVLPFVKRGSASNLSDVTLCLWDYESNVSSHSIHRLASYWKGPISLVLLLSHPATSQQIRSPAQLEAWNIHTNLSIHLVNATRQQLDSFSPNLFVNLARLLAPTSYTMLFPGDISLVSSDLRMMTQVLSDTKVSQSISVVSPGTNRVAYPPSPLSPALIPRDHPRWCTERFTFSNSRKSNWDECLWQLWLDSFGRIGGINATIESGIEEDMHGNDFATKTHQQLSSRLKAEMCDLSIKKLAMVATQPTKQKMRWLKQFCRKVTELDSELGK